MRLPRFSKGLVSLGLLAFPAGASSCSSDYGLFAINVIFASSVTPQDRQCVESCSLTVSDDSGKVLLKRFPIDPVAAPDGTLISGCAGGGRTPQIVGRPAVSYSTSRTSGTLTFTVEAVGKEGSDSCLPANQDDILHKGSASKSIKVFHGKADEQTVDIELSKAN